MRNKLNWVESHPVEAVVFIFSLCLAMYAGFILSPWYISSTGNLVALAVQARWIEVVLASFFLLTTIPGLIAPFNKKIPNKWLEWGSFGMFLSFLFLTVLRIAFYGWIPFLWLTPLAVSLGSAALRIYLRSHRT